MISFVKKRNGDVVPFDPEKLSRWAEWAKVVGVDWFDIVCQAYSKCSDGCSTEELQEAMISCCEDLRTTAGLKMAGRLLVGDLYKRVYGSHNLPHLKVQYKNMVSQGYMEDMEYSDEDLEYLDTIIDHSKDFELTSTQVRQDIQKYLLNDIVSKTPKETPQFGVMRQAMGACKNEMSGLRLERVAKMYRMISDSIINTPTPNKTNLGTLKRSYASCCKSVAGDTLASIEAQNHIYYTMTAASAGIGGFAMIRSKGDKVRNGVIKHGGKIPYFRLKEAEAKANKQGQRGGAVTEYINALDPEIFTLLALRNPTSVDDQRVDGMDYAFQYNESFVRRAKEGKDWLLISYKDSPSLWVSFFNKDSGKFDAFMDDLISEGKGKVVKARDVLKKFLSENEVTGRLYEFNATNVNSHGAFDETIWSSNLCVVPETKILTKQGYQEIGNLDGQKVELWNGEEWSLSEVFKTGSDQKIIRVVTKDGYEVECTPYHRFFKVVQDKWNKPTTIEVRAHELRKGDKLAKFDLPVIQGNVELEHAWCNGFYTGDGYSSGGEDYIAFYHDKRKLVELVKDNAASVHVNNERIKRVVVRLKSAQPKFFVPGCSYTVDSRLKWLAGLLDSDGTLSINGETQSFQIGSVNKEFLKDVQIMLQTCGVTSKVTRNSLEGIRKLPKNDGTGEVGDYYCQMSYRLLIGNGGVSKLLDLGLKTYRLQPTNHRPNRECSQFVKVEGVYDDGRYSDTYCFNEPKKNRGMFNGILAGNCMEYLAPTSSYTHIKELYLEDDDFSVGEVAICNLGAISVGRFPLTHEAYYDAAFHTLLMVDNVIEVGTFPLPQVEYTAKARRTAGVGITNLAYAMAKEGLKYSSQEGKDFCHRLAELHTYSLLKASVALAKERGACAWHNRTRYAKGWLPIDTYCKEVDNITSQPLLCDWEGLRKEIAEHGLRHSAVVNHMPVESSSIRAGDTNGLYPIRDGIVLKKSGNTKTIFIPPEWEELGGNYEKAWDIHWKDMADIYAIFQKFADQGISADMYHAFPPGDKRVSMKQLMEEFFYRNKVGMKTRYYRNFKIGASEVQQEDACDGGGCKL